jgi:hypothetical protein
LATDHWILLGKLEEMTWKWHGNDPDFTWFYHPNFLDLPGSFLIPAATSGKILLGMILMSEPFNNESKPRCWIILCNVRIDIYFLLQFMSNCRFNGLIPKLIVKLGVQSGFKVSSPP